MKRVAMIILAGAFAIGCSSDTASNPTSAAGDASATTVGAPGETTSVRRDRTPSEQDPLQVGIVGDSVTYDAALGIEQSLESTGVVDVESHAIGGVGVSVDAWQNYIDGVMNTGPEVLVVMLGGWDLGFVEFTGADEYVPLLRSAIESMTRDGQRVVWLAMPPSPPREEIEELRHQINALFASAAAANDLVQFVDTDAALGEPDGEYSRFLIGPDGTHVQARKVRDGLDDGHLCPGGAAILGDLAYASLRDMYALPERGEWLFGSWWDDPRYDDPVGGCDG